MVSGARFYDKKQTDNFIKLMKTLRRITGKNSVIYTQYSDIDDCVYISNGCVVFPIPKPIYENNYSVANLPSFDTVLNSKMDLRKFIADNMNDENKIQCRMTTLFAGIGVRGEEKFANIYRCGSDFGMVDKRYIDLISLLPFALKGYDPYAVNIKSPIVFYSDVIDMGYAILPIYSKVEELFDHLGFIRKPTE